MSRNTPELGPRADRRRRERVPVDDAVVVAVHAGAEEVGADQVAVAVDLLERPVELAELVGVAQVEPVRGVPVVLDGRRRGVGLRLRRPGVDDRGQPDDQDERGSRPGTTCRPGSGPACPCPSGPAGRPSWSTDEETTRARGYRRVSRLAHRRSARPVGSPPQAADQLLVASGHRARRRRAGTHSRPCSPIRRAVVGVGDEGGDRVRERGRRRPGARRCRRPTRRGCAATSVPASIDATTGRPAARIEYSFDGTLTAPEPGAQRHDVDVAGRQHLDEALVGHVAGEADVGQPGGARSSSTRAAPVAVDQERRRRAAAGPPRRAARATARSRRCRRRARPARRRCRARARYAVEAIGRADGHGVDEVGDRVDGRRPRRPAPWPTTLAAQVVATAP